MREALSMNEKKKKNETWEWIKALLIAFGLAAIIRIFLFTPIVVDGDSMMPTLENGDRMIVNKIGYTIGKPDRFDIVVFHAPEQKDYIKRVIGLPGDEVEYRNDVLYINGEPFEEPYLDQYKAEVVDSPLTEDFTLEEKIQSEQFPKNMYLLWGIIEEKVKIRDISEPSQLMKSSVVQKLSFGRSKDFGIVE